MKRRTVVQSNGESSSDRLQRLIQQEAAAEVHVFTAEQDAARSQFESLDYDLIDSRCLSHVLANRKQGKAEGGRRRTALMRWLLTVVVGFVTGFVALCIDFGIKSLTRVKYQAASSVIREGDSLNFLWAGITHVGISIGYVFIASALVACVEPIARGSGIPEIKCYLNGVKIPRVVRVRTLLCKAVGVLFSVAGGLPVGKEGPMIHAGAAVAAGVPQGKSSSFGFDTSWTKFKEFRNDHEKRDFVAAGAAAGVAAAFGAPVGGVLFSLEEGCTHWNHGLTWRTFVCAMVASFALNLGLSAIESRDIFGALSQPGLITFGSFKNQDVAYSVQELPLFVLLGAFGGIFGAAFNALNTRITIWRKRYVVKSRWRNMLEACLIAGVIAACTFAIPCFHSSCIKKSEFKNDDSPPSPEFLADEFGGCDKEEAYDQFALLFFSPSEETIKMLFHTKAHLNSVDLGIFGIFYYCMACITYGSAVPSGLFIPSLLSGAAFGRLWGVAIHSLGWSFVQAEPGVYALIGAASFLGGMARMTISITVILIEATSDYNYGLPLMVVLVTSRIVGNWFNEGLYDIHIRLSNIPFLEAATVGWEQSRASDVLLARDVMSSPCVSFPEVETVGAVVDRLSSCHHNGFAVIDSSSATENLLSGIILRRQLCVMLDRRVFGEDAVMSWEDLAQTYPHFPDVQDVRAKLSKEDMQQPIFLAPFCSPCPYTVQDSAPLPRVTELFRLMGLRHLPVVSRSNGVVGMVTRKDVTEDATHRALIDLDSIGEVERNVATLRGSYNSPAKTAH